MENTILDMVLKINLDGKNQCFFEVTGHIKQIRIKFYEGGWSRDTEAVEITCSIGDKIGYKTIIELLKNYIPTEKMIL